MKKYGLIGYPLGHSFSPTYFAEKFFREGLQDCEYLPYPIAQIGELKDRVLQDPDIRGLNVTIPYKHTVIPLLDDLDRIARKIGAVNCIKVSKGRLIGYNTDYIGFLKSMQPLLRPHQRNALILGTGGSSRTTGYALTQLGIDTTFVSRHPTQDAIGYQDLSETIMLKNTIIVNTTPIGMEPEVAASPRIPYRFLGPQHLLYDLIYNPELTVFLLKGREQGSVTKNGLQMLQIQAEESWDIWNADSE